MPKSQLSEIIQHLRAGALPGDAAAVTDGQLLECFVSQRDEASFAALVRRHAPMVWGVCRRVLRSHHDAEDAFQATFLVLVRRAASVVPREQLAGWLHGVAYQTSRKARAASARRRTRERQVAALPEPPAPEQEVWRDLQGALDEELSRLPERYRTAVVLCDVQGLTRREAARQLGLPGGTLSGRLTRGRAMLAKRLARRGVVPAGAAVAEVLAQNGASACPTSTVSSTIQAASLSAAARPAPGVISAEVAALTEGVLKSMLVHKTKVAAAVLLVVGILGVCATGLVYRATAGEGQNREQEQKVKADQPIKGHEEADRALRTVKAELERLRTENEALKKQLRQVKGGQTKGHPKRAGDGKLVIKFYPVAGLISPPESEENARSLVRVITYTIDPASWNVRSGAGSAEYFPAGRSLVVRQTQDVHVQVQQLLQMLEQSARQEKRRKLILGGEKR